MFRSTRSPRRPPSIPRCRMGPALSVSSQLRAEARSSAAAPHRRSVLHRLVYVCQAYLLSSPPSPLASHCRKGTWKQKITVRSFSFMNGYLFGPRVFSEHPAGSLGHCPVALAYISHQNRKVLQQYWGLTL